MSQVAEQISLDVLLEFIAFYTVEHFKNTNRRTDGANLADAIRRRFPSLTYQQVGLERLSEAVQIAEKRGLIVRHRDVKHLELSPGPKSELPAAGAVESQSFTRPLHVRPEIWRAFVFVSRRGHCFLDRETGHVVRVLDSDEVGLASHKADSRFVLIAPIPTETQQAWMEEFTRQQNLKTVDAPIHTDEWWRRFTIWLRGISPDSEREWNRFRGIKVTEYLRDWCSTNSVPAKLLWSPEGVVGGRHAATSGDSDQLSTSSEVEQLRRVIIAAVREMPLNELKEVAVPVLIHHFKSRY